jgi:hypothetical protein
MTLIPRSFAAAAMVSVLAGCASPGGSEPGAMPSVAGAYPPSSVAPGPRGQGGAWLPAAEFRARLAAEVDPLGFLHGLPPDGSRVPVRNASWPSPLRVSLLAEAGVVLTGDGVPMATLAGELRCAEGDDRASSVRLVAEVQEDGSGLAVEARYEGPDPSGCELSSTGRRRLQAVMLDVFMWARSVARAGAEMPAVQP